MNPPEMVNETWTVFTRTSATAFAVDRMPDKRMAQHLGLIDEREAMPHRLPNARAYIPCLF